MDRLKCDRCAISPRYKKLNICIRCFLNPHQRESIAGKRIVNTYIKYQTCTDVEGHIAAISESLHDIYPLDFAKKAAVAIQHDLPNAQDCKTLTTSELIEMLFIEKAMVSELERKYSNLKADYDTLRKYHNELLIKYYKRMEYYDYSK